MRVCVIPARGGSVRVPRKNIRDFRGKPMLERATDVARGSGLFDVVAVSTDDPEIANLAESLDCLVHWRQPDNGDKGTQDVAADAVLALALDDADAVCVLYPCCPLLVRSDLMDSYWAWRSYRGMAYLVSVQREPLADAGCFYWCKTNALVRRLPLYSVQTMTYALPPQRCIDINTEDDWIRAEQMFDALQPKPL